MHSMHGAGSAMSDGKNDSPRSDGDRRLRRLNVCDAAAVAGSPSQKAQLYIHVESGGTTYETLDVASDDTGSAVI